MHVPEPVRDLCVCAHCMCKSDAGGKISTKNDPIWAGPLLNPLT